MWWLTRRRRNVVTLQEFLDESAFRQQLRHLQLDFRPFDDIRRPRRLCSSNLKRGGKTRTLGRLGTVVTYLVACSVITWMSS